MARRRPELLVVAGEQSGDAMAAAVLRRLGVPAFGIGGAELRSAGMEALVDLSELCSMGIWAVAKRSRRLGRAASLLVAAVRERRPKAALLAGFSEFNARLGRWLRDREVRVLWYAPPQIWAWRPGRGRRLARSADRLALTLPFEEPLWRKLGADSEFVGHPACERIATAPRCVPEEGRVLGLLPGSRPHEIGHHLDLMLGTAVRVRPEWEPRLLLAASLDATTQQRVRRRSRAHGVFVDTRPAAAALPEMDAAVVASGTATLECVLADVSPVIVYRTDPATYAIARALVRTPHIGLPNLVLGRRAFPELVQSDATVDSVCRSLESLAPRGDSQREARRQTRQRVLREGQPPSERVACSLATWLG